MRHLSELELDIAEAKAPSHFDPDHDQGSAAFSPDQPIPPQQQAAMGQQLPAPDDAPQMPNHWHCPACGMTVIDRDDHQTWCPNYNNDEPPGHLA